MITLKPTLSIQSPSVPPSDVLATRFERSPTPSHSRISYFRSLLLDMQIYSPSVKVVKKPGLAVSQSYPVFSDRDKIEGKVTLDPSCSQNGRLTICLEGTFEYSSVKHNAGSEYHRKPAAGKHVFLSSSTVIPFTPTPDSRSTIREALGVRKRPSTLSLRGPAYRSCEFSFELPRGSRPGEEMPPTFSSSIPISDSRRLPSIEELEVSYRIIAVWEACDGSGNQAMLETPVLLQPDADFQSVDGSATVEPQSWLEMSLVPERPIPFNCAVTLPFPQSFSRCGSIPYFVVFATDTRLPCLIKEIATDATIAVSLIRKITIFQKRTKKSSILPDTPPASDESDRPSSPFAPRAALLKRSIKTLARSHSLELVSGNKPPQVESPQEALCISRTLETQVSIGFPKRPRTNDASQHPPDGLCKGEMRLCKDMLPSVDWPGICVQYYLDISVLVGQDAMTSRVPIRVY